MWPWSKKKSVSDQMQSTGEIPTEEVSAPGSEKPPLIPLEDIGRAIIALRGSGFHFGMSYAQMNGYDEELTKPDRVGELLELCGAEPNFSENGINFAIRCQIKDLTTYAERPEGFNLIIPGLETPYILAQQKAQDDLRWARELLATVLRIGKGDLERGFEEVGFDFREFLIRTICERRQEDIAAVLAEIEAREDVLRPLFLRAVARGRNKYGEIEYNHLIEEANDFFDRFFPDGSLKFFTLTPPLGLIFFVTSLWRENTSAIDLPPQEGIDFEHWCAEKIEAQGWSVTVSQASGDQGIDLVCSKDSVTVAVQCKRYSTPIGNKAIQEVYTGARHYLADAAVVVGTGGFTRSAEELARSTGVILLDAENIGDFSSRILRQM